MHHKPLQPLAQKNAKNERLRVLKNCSGITSLLQISRNFWGNCLLTINLGKIRQTQKFFCSDSNFIYFYFFIFFASTYGFNQMSTNN